jgi:hypothetical protein
VRSAQGGRHNPVTGRVHADDVGVFGVAAGTKSTEEPAGLVGHRPAGADRAQGARCLLLDDLPESGSVPTSRFRAWTSMRTPIEAAAPGQLLVSSVPILSTLNLWSRQLTETVAYVMTC